MNLTTDALIIRTNNNIGEADRFVTALTRDFGTIHASVRGAQRIKSRKMTATSLLTYARLSLYKGRKQYIIDEAEPLQVFFNLLQDIERLSLAQYFCELAGAIFPEEEPAPDALRLLLNALHLLDEGKKHPFQIKAVVELRMLSMAGYMPDLSACTGCQCELHDAAWLLVREGGIVCERCAHNRTGAIPVSGGVLAAMRHIVYGDFSKLFAFALSDDGYAALAKASEQYLLCQLQRGFKTLDFYHSVQL